MDNFVFLVSVYMVYVAVFCPSTDKDLVLNVVKFALAEIPVLNQNDGTPPPIKIL